MPDPVGARMSVWSPAAMAGQPCSWAGVGAGNEVSNQVRTAGEKTSGVPDTDPRLRPDPDIRRQWQRTAWATRAVRVPFMLAWRSQV